MTDQSFTIAMRLLARREHTAAELRQKLHKRGIEDDAITAALQRLRDLRLQDDRRFCDLYIRQQQPRFGDYRLRAELEQRGASSDDITAALAAADLPPEQTRAIAILQKKYPHGMAAADADTARRFLRARGFAGDSIRAALKTAAATQ